MATHSSATLRETPHETETSNIIISNALKRRAQSVINDTSIDPQWRAIVRYGLETNDPWLADLVRRADAGELIIDTIDFSLAPASQKDDSSEEKIEALAEIICRSSEECAAALFVLMGTLENSSHQKLLANTAKHFAFTRCSEANLYGIVDTHIGIVEAELLSTAN
ncbi:MAG TPA: hypothetical protein VFY67_03325 [Pyrinomonadaceae bacterium]|nr:hypothetical protein [Pyrinomonadaceae bacterium]